MGDDYDILCRDMLNEIQQLLDESEVKAGKKLRVLRQLYTGWRGRIVSFNAYRRPSEINYCECGAMHDQEEMDSGRCSSCGGIP